MSRSGKDRNPGKEETSAIVHYVSDLEANRESSVHELATQAAQGDQESLLEQAIEANDIELTKSLVSSGSPCPPLDFFSEELLTRIPVMMFKTLLQHPSFNVNDEDANGNTMLHKAVSAKVQEIVEVLLDHDANVDCVRESDGKTPLIIAIQGEDISVMKRLLKKKPDYEISDNDGKSAMYYVLKGCSANLIAPFLRATWENKFATHFAEVLSELKHVVWSFNSDETLSNWWVRLLEKNHRKLNCPRMMSD